MVDYELIKQNIMKQVSDATSGESGTDKLIEKLYEISVDTSILVLKEYEKQKATEI